MLEYESKLANHEHSLSCFNNAFAPVRNKSDESKQNSDIKEVPLPRAFIIIIVVTVALLVTVDRSEGELVDVQQVFDISSGLSLSQFFGMMK